MRTFVLLCLLALCHAKPYKPINIMDVLRDHDILMRDADDDDDDYDNDLFPSWDPPEPDCPFGCQCSRRVVQCSDLGLISVPDKIPVNTLMIDLQNNDITEIKEDDFKGMDKLYALYLVNNKISKVHPKAFRSMEKLQLLYLSYNLLTQIPPNLPQNILELRIHDNKINRVQKEAFKGMRSLHVLEMSANPLANKGIELGAFDSMSTLYIRIAEAKLTAVPKDLPSSLTELHLDYNNIAKVEVEDFLRYKNLMRLGLGFNQIKSVENGSLASIPNLREVHLDNNKLKKVPPGLSSLKYLQVVYLHVNSINSVGVNDFCPVRSRAKKNLYTGISLFANPVKYWDVQPATFRCVSGRRGVQLGNFRRK
ncbi:asporin [Hypomesus transpacificus]|uniref:asporin n=1 Tax=Hypomesus transpacificus TaxID=137520 RepID=UPI001F07F7C7|nr:asporin [Hypomesus transpacificus]XP_046882328.1 asporin [Hypomesus transpacificus]